MNWVVYLMTMNGRPTGRHAVCSDAEWAELDTARPGYHTLVQRYTGTEGDAEALTRSLQAPVTVQRPKRVSPFAKSYA